MSNPASFVTAASIDSGNTFTGDQTITGDLTITGDVTINGNLTHTGGATFSEVRAATTANITLSGAQTIDGVSVVAGNRVLVKNQSTATQNGIYTAATGAWSRSDDLPAGASAAGLMVVVQEGTVSADVTYLCTNDAGSDVVGTNNLVFASGAVLDSLLVHKAGAETITGVKTFASGADLAFAKEANHVVRVVASTTTDTAGGNLIIAAGDGAATNANGGNLTLDAGAKAGAGTDGGLDVGTTNASGITIGRTGKTTTVAGALAVTQGATLTGNVGVGGAAAASAALTVTSTTQGLLFPRMTEAERDAIAAPAAGLVIYNTTTNKLNLRVAAAWEVITSA